MARAELLFLRHEMQRVALRERCLHRIRAMADDHRDAGGKEARRGTKNTLDDRKTTDFMQDFGQLRLHPGALPGGENYDVDVTHWRRIQTPMLIRMQANQIWLFDQFISLYDVVDLLRGQPQTFSYFTSDVPLGRRHTQFCYLTK